MWTGCLEGVWTGEGGGREGGGQASPVHDDKHVPLGGSARGLVEGAPCVSVPITLLYKTLSSELVWRI